MSINRNWTEYFYKRLSTQTLYYKRASRQMACLLVLILQEIDETLLCIFGKLRLKVRHEKLFLC